MFVMPQMNALADLNLLRVFLAIWDLRSLTAAGARLGLTQPAVSHALGRLRRTFDDPLFVRAPGGMVPTDAATRLHAPLGQAFGIINRALHEHAAFDPATADRAFRIAMSDVSEFYYLPPLLGWLGTAAPGVRIETVQVGAGAAGAALRTGEIDLVVGYVPGLDGDCVSERLFMDAFVCLVRAGHPAGGGALTVEGLGGLRFVHADTNASGHRMVEQHLAGLGIVRRHAVRTAHFTVAPEIVGSTDLAVLFPRSVAERVNRGGGFCLLELPFVMPDVEIAVHSHSHFAGDLGIRWLRGRLVAMFGEGLV